MKKIYLIVTGLIFCWGTMSGPSALALLVPGRQEPVRYLENEKQVTRTKEKRTSLECGYRKPIRVAGFATNPPFGWVDVQTMPGIAVDRYFTDGFSYSLFKKMADELDLFVDGVGFQSFYDALTALRKGEIDVLLGSYYDKRTLGSNSSIVFPGYFSNPIIVMFITGHEKDVKSLEDLKGLKGVIRQEENLYSLFYETIPEGVQIEQVSGARQAYTLLLTGKVDYMITSLYAAEAEIRRFKITDRVVLTRTPLMEPELFFVFSSSSKCLPLKKMFVDQLKKEKANGTVNKLLFQEIDKWVDRFHYAPSLVDDISRDLALQPQPQPQPQPEEKKPTKRKKINYPKTVKNQGLDKPVKPTAVKVPAAGANVLDSVLKK